MWHGIALPSALCIRTASSLYSMKPFDIQVNGYFGGDFTNPGITAEELHQTCVTLEQDGVDSILATVITDDVAALCGKLSHLVQLREEDELAKKIIAGFHIEGPFINPEVGYVGAHPIDCVKPANIEDSKRLLEATAGLTKLVTLAPEFDEGMATTRFLADQGITVSAGHCNPSLDQLKAGIDAGLSMVTHLGNGCPVTMPRHDNIIQRALSLSDKLWCCFIPDGAHVDFFALGNYLKVAGIDRSIMVTDAIAAAKLGPGRYTLSGMEIEVDEQGVARKPGSPNLAGATVTMPQIQENLSRQLGLDEEQIKTLIDSNPRKAIRI